MIRVLHLLDRHADFQTTRGADALTRSLGPGFSAEAQSLGRTGDLRDVLTAVRRLRRRRDVDVVHAWGPAALTAAALAGVGRVVHSPRAESGRRELRWMQAVLGYRDVQVVLPTVTLWRACVGRGIPVDRCHVVRPGVDFARVKRRRDAALRARLGLADDDFVLLAAGESTDAAAHARAVWAVAILNELDPRYKLLAWGRGSHADRLATFAARLHQPGLLRLAKRRLGPEVEFEDLLPATDAVLVTAWKPVATLPIAACMAAALPIVSTVTSAVAELLEDRHTALMVADPAPRQITQRVLDLRADASLQWAVSDMAKTEAFEFFSLTRFLNQYRTIYRQVAGGEKVDVPEPAPGAGLRFHGRG